MFNEPGQDDLFATTDALEALSQLEQNTCESLVRQRASERVQIRTKVVVRPGNSSQRHELAVEGLTGDISNGGCQILTGRPVLPGDIFWLEFSDEHIAIGSLLARCMRCRMIREDTFEVGFRFLHEIDLAGALKHRNDHEW